MYVAKCVNKEYMEKKLGDKRPGWEKFFIGFCLIIGVVLALVGPLILFSSLNPVSELYPITGATLSLSLAISDSSTNTNQTLNLFSTTQPTQITMMNETYYNDLNFSDYTQTTAQFKYQ
jgi:hypothetical protein